LKDTIFYGKFPIADQAAVKLQQKILKRYVLFWGLFALACIWEAAGVYSWQSG
jgi:hypothetical protein